MHDPVQTLPVTAIVGSHDEADLLVRCLPSIAFCDEVIVIDIASSDDTAEIAAAHGARVIRHEWVPIAERARVNLVGEARHEWLLFIDPDEVFPPALAHQLADLLPTLGNDVAIVRCPWRFYFRGKPLRGTIWGGVTSKKFVVRRGGVDLHPNVHGGTTAKPGTRSVEISYTGDNAVAHHWAESYRSLVSKHARYLSLEGPDRRAAGLVTGFRDIATTPLSAFGESFSRRRGYLDGFTGLALSVLWSTYATAAKVQLFRELRREAAR